MSARSCSASIRAPMRRRSPAPTPRRPRPRATLIQAEENFKRQEGLAAQRVATQKAYEDAVAARDQARAAGAVDRGRRADGQAQHRIHHHQGAGEGADQPGVAARGHADPGAADTLLTTITQLDPAYVNFTFTDCELRQLQEIDKSPEELFDSKNVKVELQFGDGAVYPQTGTVDTRSRTVDPRTGTILIRAIFPNRDGALLPGQFVRVKMTGIVMPNAIVIPKIAISQGPLGPFVYRRREGQRGAGAPGAHLPRAARRLHRAQGPGGRRPHRRRRRDPRAAGQRRATRCRSSRRPRPAKQ